MILIGDTHGKVNQYWKLIQKNKKEDSIQVGDFGFLSQHNWFRNNLNTIQHNICFGNHDWLPFVNEQYSCGDTKYYPEQNLCTIRGGYSYDKHLRTIGIDWFPDEEMEYSRLKEVIEEIIAIKPKIIVSHTCPKKIALELFKYPHQDPSITEQAMQFLFEDYQPEFWIFGHHHRSVNKVINNTNFICLKELEIYKI